MWKTTLVKHVKENEVLNELYYDLRDIFFSFYNTEDMTDEEYEALEKKFWEYLVEFHIAAGWIYITVGKDSEALANNSPWITWRYWDVDDVVEFVEAIKNLPEDE